MVLRRLCDQFPGRRSLWARQDGVKGRQAATIKRKEKAIFIYLTGKISSDRSISDLTLKQMDLLNAMTDKLTCLR